MTHSSIRTTLLCSSALLAFISAPVLAQDDVEEVSETTAAEESGDVVTVTGSRIRRDEFSSSAPIDVLTADEVKIEGISDVASLLRSSTAASGSSQITAGTSSAFVQDGGVGAETLSLRGLGANRTLILLNGRRAGPSGTRGAVSAFDLNSIPLAAIERVEILKDGASSVYGSDAVAGVVNIFTRKDDGGTIEGYFSQPEDSGGEEARISASWGKSFDRGYFRATADYYKQNDLARGDRSYLNCDEAYAFDPDTGARIDVNDPRTGVAQCRDLLWGHVWIYDYAPDPNVPPTSTTIAQFDYDGSLAANIPGYPTATDMFQMTTPAGWFPVYYDQDDIDGLAAWNGINVGDVPRGIVNFDHPYQDEEALLPEVERVTLFLEGDYELTDHVKAYGEALFNRRETYANGYRQYWTYVYGERSEVFGGTWNNPEASAQGWTGAQWFSPTAITDHADDTITVDYMRFVGGLAGDFDAMSRNWEWDLAYQYSKSDGEYVGEEIRADSIEDYWFNTTLCSEVNGGVTSYEGLPCVDVPWFDPQLLAGNPSQEVRDFLFTTATGNTEYTQTALEGYITGDLFELPAGTLKGAVGFLYQTDEINDVPDQMVQDGNAWQTSTAGITAGDSTATEFYAEFDIPLLSDLPLIEQLDLTVSGRTSDIDVVEDKGETYRVALNWRMTPTFRVRATQGTSFRAPELFELFLADQTSSARQSSVDPCIDWANELADGAITQTVANNCAADGVPDDFLGGAISATVAEGGGLGVLNPETSENKTFGVVWTPDFINLDVAVDYFDIEITDEITTLSPFQIVNGCYSSTNFGSEPLCELFDRNAPDASDPNRITDIRASFINIDTQKQRGIDFAARYTHDFSWGRLAVDAQATHTIESVELLLADDDIEDFNGEIGEPKTTGYLNFTASPNNNWEFFYGIDMVDQTSNRDRERGLDPTPTLYGVPAQYKVATEFVAYHTLSAQYELEDWSFRLGVANLYDEHPPAISRYTDDNNSSINAGNSPLVSQYDFLGRRVFFNVSKNF